MIDNVRNPTAVEWVATLANSFSYQVPLWLPLSPLVPLHRRNPPVQRHQFNYRSTSSPWDQEVLQLEVKQIPTPIFTRHGIS